MRGGKKPTTHGEKDFYSSLTPHLQAGRRAFFAQLKDLFVLRC